jgi:hypothetical protein
VLACRMSAFSFICRWAARTNWRWSCSYERCLESAPVCVQTAWLQAVVYKYHLLLLHCGSCLLCTVSGSHTHIHSHYWVTPSQTNMFPWKRLEYNNEQCFLCGMCHIVITETSLDPRSTPVRDLHLAFQTPFVYEYITK